MTIYVGTLDYYGPSKGVWSHMMTDNYDDLTELHQFAARLGLKRAWFHDTPRNPHYDLRPSKHHLAIELGAIPVRNSELVKRCGLMFRETESESDESEDVIERLEDMPGIWDTGTEGDWKWGTER